MRDAAIVWLEEWAGEADDPDRDQRRWKQAWGDAAVAAYERLGVLSPEEGESWRRRFRGGARADTAPADISVEDRQRALEYLAALIDSAPRLTRDPAPGDVARGAECTSALEALQAIGVLSPDEHDRWYGRLMERQAPWLEQPIAPPREGALYAIAIPPATEEEAEQDRRFEAEWAARPRAERVERVVAGSPERHDGIALVAVVVHEDATSLHFHHVGDELEDGDLFDLDAFEGATRSLTPPALTDDLGTSYGPLGEGPASAHGPGGAPGVRRRQVVSGRWLYEPAAPDAARVFLAARGESRWRVGVDSARGG